MKNIFKDFFSQCARPEGFLGRCMLRFMNLCHAPLTNWGLDHVSFRDGMTMLDIGCGGGATLKLGGQFAIMLEVIEGDSKWTNVVEGMIVYPPEQLKDMLEQAGFSDVEVFRRKPSYATIKGILK